MRFVAEIGQRGLTADRARFPISPKLDDVPSRIVVGLMRLCCLGRGRERKKERERERERERETDRQTERQTDRETDRHTDRQTDRGREYVSVIYINWSKTVMEMVMVIKISSTELMEY